MVSFFSGTSQDYVDMYLAAAEGMLVSSTWFSAHYLQAISADHNVVPVLIPTYQSAACSSAASRGTPRFKVIHSVQQSRYSIVSARLNTAENPQAIKKYESVVAAIQISRLTILAERN